MTISYDQALDLYTQAFGIDPRVDPDSERRGYLRSLYEYAAMLPKPCRILEIGTYRGCSAGIMACALHGTPSQIICIDPVFEGGELYCDDVCVEKRVRYASELRNVVNRWSVMQVSHLISVIPRTSAEVFSIWDQTMLDMVLVDGAHTAAMVGIDCRWLEHVRVGGIFVVDDWIEEIRDAVLKYFSTRPNWSLEFESTSTPPDEHPQWAITLFRRNS